MRRRYRVLTITIVAVALLLSESVTRGHVHGQDDRPLADADVWLADSALVTHRSRTDDAGYFRIFHAPFTRSRSRLLICHGGTRLHVDTIAHSALFWTEYGLGNYQGRFPDAPSDRGWVAAVPASCPVKVTPPAD